MALIQSFEKSGNFLFKYRGQLPVLFFLIGLPFIYFGDYSFLSRFTPEGRFYFYIVILIISIIVSLTGFIIRSYTIGTTPRGTSGRNTEKQVAERLNTKGIYSVVRHPLYLGNYLMWAGLLLFTLQIPLFIIVSLLFWLYYERIMFAEESYLRRQFGEQFERWSEKVPAFIPAFRRYEKGTIPFSFKAVLRREYTGLFAIVFCYTVIDYWMQFTFCVRYDSLRNYDGWIRPSLIVLFVTLVLMLVLRTLKHHTSLLTPDNSRD